MPKRRRNHKSVEIIEAALAHSEHDNSKQFFTTVDPGTVPPSTPAAELSVEGTADSETLISDAPEPDISRSGSESPVTAEPEQAPLRGDNLTVILSLGGVAAEIFLGNLERSVTSFALQMVIAVAIVSGVAFMLTRNATRRLGISLAGAIFTLIYSFANWPKPAPAATQQRPALAAPAAPSGQTTPSPPSLNLSSNDVDSLLDAYERRHPGIKEPERAAVSPDIGQGFVQYDNAELYRRGLPDEFVVGNQIVINYFYHNPGPKPVDKALVWGAVTLLDPHANSSPYLHNFLLRTAKQFYTKAESGPTLGVTTDRIDRHYGSAGSNLLTQADVDQVRQNKKTVYLLVWGGWTDATKKPKYLTACEWLDLGRLPDSQILWHDC